MIIIFDTKIKATMTEINTPKLERLRLSYLHIFIIT